MPTIRPIALEDAARFRETLDVVCSERKYLAAVEAPPLAEVGKFVAANVQAGHAQFVAEADGRIVGWCDALPGTVGAGTPHVGRLGMGVLPAYRGKKIGARLLEATLAAARRQGLERIELSVYAANAPAVALYRKFGFEIEGVKKRGRLMDGVYDDVILMALALGPSKGTTAPA